MKKTRLYKTLLPLITTILLAFLIILTGYNILAKAGNNLADSKNSIVAMSDDDNSYYIFYSKNTGDISLFPWNYSNNTSPFISYYGSELSASDVIDTSTLYNNLRYYFYRCIDGTQKDYIYKSGLSLAEIMNYDKLEQFITVYGDYYFYSQIIDISKQSYSLNAAFNDEGYIYAFQCREIHADEDYTTKVMDKADTFLKSLLSNSSDGYLNIILSDITYLDGILSNYSLNTSTPSSLLNYREEYSSYIQSKISEYNNYTEYYDENNVNSIIIYNTNSNSSCQLVKTQYEYLIVISDAEIVLHYDPINDIFNGFNLNISH
jgi:hypothetical protein